MRLDLNSGKHVQGVGLPYVNLLNCIDVKCAIKRVMRVIVSRWWLWISFTFPFMLFCTFQMFMYCFHKQKNKILLKKNNTLAGWKNNEKFQSSIHFNTHPYYSTNIYLTFIIQALWGLWIMMIKMAICSRDECFTEEKAVELGFIERVSNWWNMGNRPFCQSKQYLYLGNVVCYQGPMEVQV